MKPWVSSPSLGTGCKVLAKCSRPIRFHLSTLASKKYLYIAEKAIKGLCHSFQNLGQAQGLVDVELNGHPQIVNIHKRD